MTIMFPCIPSHDNTQLQRKLTLKLKSPRFTLFIMKVGETGGLDHMGQKT